MPKLYVANCTQQIQQFAYHLPEGTRAITQEIPIGGQILIGGRALPQTAVDAVLEAHQKYGLVSVAEAHRVYPFHGLTYSIDKPVGLNDLYQLVERRKGVLVDRGRETRQTAAVATHEFIENQMFREQVPGRLDNLETSVEEVARDQRDETPEVSEGTRVRRDPNQSDGRPRPPARRRNSQRTAD